LYDLYSLLKYLLFIGINAEKNVIDSKNEKYDEVTELKKCLSNNPDDKLNRCDIIKNNIDDKQTNTKALFMLNNILVNNTTLNNNNEGKICNSNSNSNTKNIS